MGYFAEDIFYTIFLSKKFTIDQVATAAHILRAFLIGLSFFSFNKIVLNMYYALNNTWIPAVIAAVAALVNVVCDYYFITHFQAFGLALATSISGMVQSSLFVAILYYWFGFTLYGRHFFIFLVRYLVQLSCCMTLFILIYKVIVHSVYAYTSPWMQHIILHTVVLWMWIGPLVFGFFALLFLTKDKARLKLHFLD